MHINVSTMHMNAATMHMNAATWPPCSAGGAAHGRCWNPIPQITPARTFNRLAQSRAQSACAVTQIKVYSAGTQSNTELTNATSRSLSQMVYTAHYARNLSKRLMM